jgi:hypothetical protein
LARAFRQARFDPIEIWTDFDDQYVLIVARPGEGNSPLLANEFPAFHLERPVMAFSREIPIVVARWRGWIKALQEQGKKVVLWGGGSKGVAFLTTLGIGVENGVKYVVDINPRRNGTFIAGGGQQIVRPTFLTEYQPDVVLMMSPIYEDEITEQLNRLGVKGALLVSSEEPLSSAAAMA